MKWLVISTLSLFVPQDSEKGSAAPLFHRVDPGQMWIC